MTREGVGREALIADPCTGGNSENLGMYRSGGYLKPLQTTATPTGELKFCLDTAYVFPHRLLFVFGCGPPVHNVGFLRARCPHRPRVDGYDCVALNTIIYGRLPKQHVSVCFVGVSVLLAFSPPSNTECC